MKDYNYILQIIADAYRITPEDITGESRISVINNARKMVCLVLQHEPTKQVGELINRSIDIVRRNKNLMLEEIEIYPNLLQKYNNIMSQIQSDMTITLKLSQLESLYAAINYYLNNPAQNTADELIHLHLDDIAERIRKRIKNRKPNLNLDEKQIKAFTLWHMWSLGKVNDYNPHSAMTMIDIINQIKPVACRS